MTTAIDIGYLAGLYGHTIQFNGTNLTQRSFLNFSGLGLSVTDSPSTNSTIVTFSPTIASLTESGANPSTSGFINLIAASLGVWGGTSNGDQVPLLDWNGDDSTRAWQIGHATDCNSVQTACATMASISVGGQTQCNINATNTVIAGPDGASCSITLDDDQVVIDAATRVVVAYASDERLIAAASKTTLLGPSGTVNIEIGASAISVAATTQSTVGAAGGASALPATPSGYLQLTVNGVPYVVPFYAPS